MYQRQTALKLKKEERKKRKGFIKERAIVSHPGVDGERRKLPTKISPGVLNTKEKLAFCEYLFLSTTSFVPT